MTKPGIRVSSLEKRFNGFEALKGVSLEIKEPGLYGLIGPNGAGKTTLFKCITGLLLPSKGAVFLNEKLVKPKNLEYRNQFGFLPEDSGLYEKFLAKEFLLLVAGMHGLSKEERKKKVKEIVDFVGIKYSPTKIIKHMSTGQKRLLLIASVLLHDPQIIILDESLNGLDPIHREQVSNVMRKLAKTKIVFFSSHVLSDIWRLCQQIYVISAGNLILKDSPENIVHRISKNKFFVSINTEIEIIYDFLEKDENINDMSLQGDKIVFELKEPNYIHQLILKLLKLSNINSFGPFIPDLDQLFVRMVNMQ